MALERDLATVTPQGKLRFSLHRGQWKAWQSPKRFVLVLAGTQGGKTSFGPLWLYREIQHKGPGDYIVATPTFPLLELKLLPEFRRLFEQHLALGRYVGSPSKKFVFSPGGFERTFGRRPAPDDPPVQIFFGHAQDPDSLESATAKAAWLDEAGQKKFRRDSWQAILRRLSIHQGRVLLTTTPYYLGWLKTDLHDPARQGHPDIELINFKSLDNPNFPRAEYERARSTLPRWKFDMFYNGLFVRPAGQIYDCFDPAVHVRPAFVPPEDWPRFLGLDFGGVNTAAVKLAKNPAAEEYFVYAEYKAGGRTAREHVEALMRGEPRVPYAVGGARSEGNWRLEFAAAGLGVLAPPVADVEVGINRVYGLLKSGRLYVMDNCPDLIDEISSYSRVLDENDEPTEQIEDKETYHRADALRYIATYLARGINDWQVKGEQAG